MSVSLRSRKGVAWWSNTQPFQRPFLLLYWRYPVCGEWWERLNVDVSLAKRCLNYNRTKPPEVQITNPSGGVLGGDCLHIHVSLAPGSAATVLTQAAGKVYKGVEARQRTTFRVEKGGFLEYLPHHLIPFAHSSYRQE